MRLYLAGPLFTQAERRYNRELGAALLRAAGERGLALHLFLPQDFPPRPPRHKRELFRDIFQKDLFEIRKADVVAALLDGADSDSGTAFEVGYAHGLGKPVIGVRTDFRKSEERGVNLMLAFACAGFVTFLSFNEDVEALAREILRKAEAAAKTVDG